VIAGRLPTGPWRLHLAGSSLPLSLAVAATLALPPALLYARAVADILMCCVGALFLARNAAQGEWTALRRGWVWLALVFWAWLLLATVVQGTLPALLQALASLRLLLFALALQEWVLAEAAARRWLGWVVLACAGWIALECWQQYLLGRNLFGYPRWGDGALTGPVDKPRAGAAYLAVFFPAFLPLVMRWLDRPAARARLGGCVLLGLAVATMVLIGQRMPTLLLVLGLLACGLLLRRFRLPMLLALLAGALLLAATPVLSPPTFQKLVLHFLDQMRHFVTSSYGLLYVRALVMLAAHPWLGLGFDGFRHNCADPQYFRGIAWLGLTDQQSGGLDGCNLHPHNYYLEMATDAGVAGLALFAVLAGVWLRDLARRLTHAADPVRVALFVAALLALWPLASTTALFVVPTSGWLLLMLGWGLAESRAAGAAREGVTVVAVSSHAATPLAVTRPKNVTA
jgi:O-antigen ligase